MMYNKETKMINLLFAIFATSALAVFFFVPQALWIPVFWFMGHLSLGVYRGLIKPYVSYFRTLQPIRA